MARKNTGARKTDMFGNAHGTNGKGDVDRTTDRVAYVSRFPESLTGEIAGLQYVGGGRYRKVYGS